MFGMFNLMFLFILFLLFQFKGYAFEPEVPTLFEIFIQRTFPPSKHGEEEHKMYTTKDIFEEDTDRILARLVYKKYNICLRCFYSYDLMHRLIKISVDNGNTEDPFNLSEATEQLITTYAYNDNGNIIETKEVFVNLIQGLEKILSQTLNVYSEGNTLCKSEMRDSKNNIYRTTYTDKGLRESVTEILSDGITSQISFSYDHLNRIISIVQEKAEKKYAVSYEYQENGKCTFTIYEDGIIPERSADPMEPWEIEIENSKKYFNEMVNGFVEFFADLGGIQKDFILNNTLHKKFEAFAETVLGKSIFHMTGYYSQPVRHGIYGSGEINDKVRILLVNGIMNYTNDHMENLEMFSKSHGRVNIHYLFRPCEGWTKDMLLSLFSKLGFMSTQSHLIAKTWKNLISDMGGPENGGTIIHYAHSIGSTDTDIAKNLLTPEERKMIRVYTFGSPTLIPNGEFQYVQNYVSRRDGVCLLDPIRYVEGLMHSDTNIVFLDTYWGIPFVDHTLTRPSYHAVIEELGRQFIENYIDKNYISSP